MWQKFLNSGNEYNGRLPIETMIGGEVEKRLVSHMYTSAPVKMNGHVADQELEKEIEKDMDELWGAWAL